MNDAVRAAVLGIFDAWHAVAAPWRAEAIANCAVSDMCILASGACGTILQGEFGFDSGVMGVDLYEWNAGLDTFDAKVEHPVDGSAIQASGYLGHVVATIKVDAKQYIVDAELRVIAPYTGKISVGESGSGTKYMFIRQADHTEFQQTDAWATRNQAAAALKAALGEGSAHGACTPTGGG